MSFDLTPGPALECNECDETSGVTEAEARAAEVCPMCGSDMVTAVTIKPCPNGTACTDPDHHFGTGMHHVGEGVW